MAEESALATQIVRLLLHQPPGVWELIDAQEPARVGDITLRNVDGTPVAYARPAS